MLFFDIENRLVAVAASAGPMTQAALAARIANALAITKSAAAPIAKLVRASEETTAAGIEVVLRNTRALERLLPRPAGNALDRFPAPAFRPTRWDAPALATTAQLADFLGLPHERLHRLAASLRRGGSSGARAHYHAQWLPKRAGGFRLVEAPKARLKALQRTIHHGILAGLPLHEAACGFRPGGSVQAYAAPHAGAEVVLRGDLRHFFATVWRGKVLRVFAALGYPHGVAELLATLCTHAGDAALWAAAPAESGLADAPSLRKLYEVPHLPQGAPTSPALANLAAFRLDCRLSAWARAAGVRYTRYADDLAFSGARSALGAGFEHGVAAIIRGCGFLNHPDKRRWMPQSVRQALAGTVVNARPNLPRDQYDALRATLWNCVRHGPAGQNRIGAADFRAHLLGRIAWAAQFDAARGAKLKDLFARIRWE